MAKTKKKKKKRVQVVVLFVDSVLLKNGKQYQCEAVCLAGDLTGADPASDCPGCNHRVLPVRQLGDAPGHIVQSSLHIPVPQVPVEMAQKVKGFRGKESIIISFG